MLHQECSAMSALVLSAPISVFGRTAAISLHLLPLVSLRQLFYFYPFHLWEHTDNSVLVKMLKGEA